MARRTLSLSKVYGLIEPGPVLLLSTAWKGQRDVMAMSWHNMPGRPCAIRVMRGVVLRDEPRGAKPQASRGRLPGFATPRLSIR